MFTIETVTARNLLVELYRRINEIKATDENIAAKIKALDGVRAAFSFMVEVGDIPDGTNAGGT